MDAAIAARWAGSLILVNVAGTIAALIAWAAIGGSGALMVYGLTFALTVLLVVSGMNSTRVLTPPARSVRQEYGEMIDPSLAVRSSSANATKI